jgi:preprotein translocase subunit SecE
MKIVSYISESFEELKSNMTWPEWLRCNVLLVVVISVLSALATWGVDEFCISISWIFNWIKANFVMTDNNLKKWYVVER